jgi:HD-like signal output (HDOD) protein
MVAVVDTGEAKEKAQRTLGRVLAGMETWQAPIISQIIRIIKDISGRPDKLSVSDLAEFISSEPTTMARILAIASGLGYNPSGAEITSIHHAISIIGFDRVRTLVVSLLLLETAQSEIVAETNRELAGLALISGLVAAEMGRRTVPVDPDLAFVCGALRNYGRMLAATFIPEEYLEVAHRWRPGSNIDSFKMVFGISSLELGRQVLAGLQLPKTILSSFVELSGQTRRHATYNSIATLIATADFSLRFVEMIQSPDCDGDNFGSRLESHADGYDGAFHLSPNSARDVLEKVLLTVESFNSCGGFSVRSVRLFRRLEALALDRPVENDSSLVFSELRLAEPSVTLPALPKPRPAASSAPRAVGSSSRKAISAPLQEPVSDPGGIGLF